MVDDAVDIIDLGVKEWARWDRFAFICKVVSVVCNLDLIDLAGLMLFMQDERTSVGVELETLFI